MRRSFSQFLVCSVCLLAAVGCGPKGTETSNADMANAFGGEKYERDIVTTKADSNFEDRGKGVSMEVLVAIEDAFERVYLSEFEECIEEEMARLGNRYVGGPFNVEVVIETSGRVSEMKWLKVDVKERQPLPKSKELREATEFTACVDARSKEWTFDPAPEVQYRHTYSGKVGAAW